MGIFEEITKKKNNSSNNTLFNEITSSISAIDKLKEQKNRELKAKRIADDYARENNVISSYLNDRTAPNRATAINIISNIPKYDNSQKQFLSQPNKYEALNKNIEETQKRYTDYYNSPEYQNYVNEYYKTPMYQYKADLERVNNQDDFSLGEKAFTSFFGGLRSSLHGDRQYRTTDSNGKTVYVDLPNYQQLKSEKIKEQSGTIGKIYQDAMASIGQMVPSIVAGSVTGGLGLGTELGSLGTMAINAYSGSKNEKLLNGYSEKQAETYGALSAGVEVLTEKMFGGLGKLMGTGALDEVVTNRLTKNISNRVAKGLAELGISSLGEGIEEIASDALQPMIKKIALSDKRSIRELFADENIGEDFFAGVLSSIILGGYNTVKTVNNNINNQNNEIDSVDNSIVANDLNNIQTNTISNNSYSDVDNNEQLITNNLDEYKQKIQQRNNLKQQEKLNNQVNNMQKQINEINSNIEDIKSNNEITQLENNNDNMLNKQLLPINNKANINLPGVKTQLNNIKTESVNDSFNLKQKQFDLINASNPMLDDYHVGIRNIEDIKTFEEAIQDDESFTYGDYTKEDAQRDLENGTIIVYSSNPIEQGTFVSTSQNMARDYAGNGKVYSKKVNPNDVAWINGDEGQFAKIENKYYNEGEELENGRTNNRYASQSIPEYQKYGNGSNQRIVNQKNQGSKFIGKSNESNIDRSMYEITRRTDDRSIEEKANERQNSDRIPNRDDEGKLVSEEQRRFNQNVSPLVKNKNGELLHFFHGSNANFSEFDLSKGGKSNSKAAVGFWFTKSKDGATKWAKETLNSDKPIIYDTYLKIENPKIYESIDNSSKIKQLEEQISKLEKDRMSLYNKLQENYDNYGDAITYYNLADEQAFKKIFEDRGYKNYNELYNDTKSFVNTRDSINNLYDELELLKFAQDSYDRFLNDIYDIEGTKPSNRKYNSEVSNETLNKYRQMLIDQGYDGIAIIDTNYDKMYFGGKNTQIAALFSNQIKDVNNMHPTESNDIYDKENNIKLPTQNVNLPGINSSYKNSLVNEDNSINYDDLPFDMNESDIKTIENHIDDRTRNKIANNLKSTLELGNNEFKEFKNILSEISKKDNITKSEIRDIIESKFSEKTLKYRLDDIVNIQKVLKNTKISVSDGIKADIGDYSDFRQKNYGKLGFSKEGMPVDSVYQELVENYPSYFSEDIINPSDQLQEMAYVANLDKYAYENSTLSQKAIDEATDWIYDSIEDYNLQEKVKQNKMSYDEYLEKSKIQNMKKTKKIVNNELLNEMNITTADLSAGKDISSLNYQITDPIRVNEKVFGYEVGQKINDAVFNKTKHNTAEKTRFLNKEREDIANLGIKARSKESAAVQKYAEKQYVNDKGEVVKYGDHQLAAEFPDIETQNKIKKAAEALRNKYDKYIDQINGVITKMGYDPIPKRNDYMKHFNELSDKLSEWGIPLNRNSLKDDVLPTDINGITDQFKPGKNWFASAMQRKGIKTTYDAITGIDSYLEGAGNLIYHTEDIQRYRALSKLIRETYGQSHGLDNVDLSTKEGKQRLNEIFDNKLSKYAAWLDEQANALAGKKGAIDRGVERALGRKIYGVLETAKKQVGSNMTGFNVRSALTNFASAVQGASKTNKVAFIKGTVSTIKNMISNDGLINKSDFLTSRFGSDMLSKKLWQKASNAGQILMTGTDYFTSNQIWRSKYYENLQRGMSEEESIKKADDFASRIMGDRSQGSTAEIFNSKTLGLLTQFQLEVNNQWQSIIHDNKIDIKSGNKSGATIMFQLGQLATFSFLFNNFMKALTGSDVMIDPLDILKKIIGNDDDEEKTLEEKATEIIGDIWNDLPFVSFLSGGRMPMSEAFKGGETLLKYATGQTDKYGNKIKLDDVKKDTIESAYYWLLPTGYGQLKKTSKGLSMYDKKLPIAGSYTDSGNLRFTADESTGGKIKAALFGQYSSKESQKYIDNDYTTIKKNNIAELKELNMSSSEYVKYRKELNASGTTNYDKINYIINSNYTKNQKNIMAKNVMNEDVTKYAISSQITPNYYDYAKWNNEIKKIKENTTNDKQETIKYINSLNLSIPQKALFIKLYYSSFDDYNEEIINYINSKNISTKEKEEILTKLKFKIKDGKVYW